MLKTAHQSFLTEEVPQLLQNLQEDTIPAFGIMTPQHMIEHLIWVVKSSSRRKGEPENPPTERQLRFQKFLSNGAIFKHYPSDKTAADLTEVRLGSLQEAKDTLIAALNQFYAHYQENPDFKAYSPFMGELGFETIEPFHHSHFRFHFWQFGLIPQYP